MGMPDVNVGQLPPYIETNVETQAVKEYNQATIQQKSQWDFEQKSKDTITAIGEIWGYAPLLLTLLGVSVGGIFRKRLLAATKMLFKKGV